jgi:hypothetical protein
MVFSFCARTCGLIIGNLRKEKACMYATNIPDKNLIILLLVMVVSTYFPVGEGSNVHCGGLS